jgi:1-acyl-sn-glycerol-3-phosphate acyltransferase
MDVMCLFSSLPLPKVNSCYAVAAADYFFSNDVIAYLSRIVANTMPFSRVYGAHAGLKACGMLMDQGKSLIIYPEGTRSRTGEIQPFKNGIGILMAERKEPVVPVYINGTFYALPKGSFWPNHKPVSMIVGEPLYFEKYESNAENWEIIAKAVEDKVRELKVKLTSILEAEKKEP